MRVLTEAQFQVEAQPLLDELFQSLDPYGQPFQPIVRQRRLVYEYWYGMEEPLFTIIRTCAERLGEEGFYMTIPDAPPEAQRRQPYHYYFTFREQVAYRHAAISVQNVIYSERGSWAILGSDEHFGLLGGTISFMDSFNGLYGQAREQRAAFLAAWDYNQHHYGSDITWIPKLLNHIDGV
jgi:hypothetical protein